MTWWWTALTVAGFVPSIGFVALYLRSPYWWSTQLGQNLMAKAATLALLFGLSLLSLEFRLPTWVWVALMVTLDAVLWWRLLLLWRIQRKER